MLDTGRGAEEHSPTTPAPEYGLYHMRAVGRHIPITRTPMRLSLDIDGVQISTEPDTGAAATLMPLSMFQRLWPGRAWGPSV